MARPADSELLYEDAPCGLLVTDVDGAILRANQTFCAWLGRPRDELLGRRLQSLLTVGGRIFLQTHWSPLLKMQGSLSEVKLELVHADGQRIPMVMNARVRSRDGVEIHELAVFSARDRHRYERELLTARERAESHLRSEQQSQKELAEARARLELAVDAAQLFQWSIEWPGRTRRYAPQVALLLGHAEACPVDAIDFLDRIHPDDRASEHAALDAFLESGCGRFRSVFRLLGIDGVERWIAAWGRVRLEVDSGAPVDFVGVLQDVTESHHQRALAEDRALLAEQTLGIVGHDLRNPLAAIQMGTEMLARRELDLEQQRALATRMQSSTRRANRLIADLLDFTQARIGRGLRLTTAPADAHAIARDVVAELAAAHPARRIRHSPEGDGAFVADADRVAQALGNLVSNALTYGDPGGEVAVVSVGSTGRVGFEVRNQGQPIPDSLRPSLFEPMTRGDNPGHLRSVGLGLYIVREIVQAHGGCVDCESSEADGTTFVISMPR